MTPEIWGLLIFSVVFGLVYNFSLWYAGGLTNVPSIVLQIERHIPFLPWTIVPYLSSGIFFCVVFFLLKSKNELYLFLKRVLMMTVLAGIGFIFFPLKNAFVKPEVANPVFDFLFSFLDGVDDPYNQSPSLHVAFAYAFWTVFQGVKTRWKPVIAIWLVLVALSTLTTFQHHLIDIFTGSILAHTVFLIFPAVQERTRSDNFHASNYYYLSAWVIVTVSFVLAEFYGHYWFNLLWLSAVFFAVGYYQRTTTVAYVRRELVRIAIKKKLF